MTGAVVCLENWRVALKTLLDAIIEDAGELPFTGFLAEIERESVGTISATNYLKWVQRSLNRLYGPGIPTDGSDSSAYRDAVRRFNREYTGRDYADVDEETQNNLIFVNEAPGSYVAWVVQALNAAGFGPIPLTDAYTTAILNSLRRFQRSPKVALKGDGFVGSKTELALIKASGLLPPGEASRKPKPRGFDRRKLARKLLDLGNELSREGVTTIRDKRVRCLIRLLTSHLVDGEKIDDCFVDTAPPLGKLRCRERLLTRLARRNLDESATRFRKAVFDLYDEIKRPLEETKLALIKIGADTTRDAIVNTPECTFVRFFKKKARDPKSIYFCFSTYIASFGSQCDLS